jgi:hypothetical protein
MAGCGVGNSGGGNRFGSAGRAQMGIGMERTWVGVGAARLAPALPPPTVPALPPPTVHRRSSQRSPPSSLPPGVRTIKTISPWRSEADRDASKSTDWPGWMVCHRKLLGSHSEAEGFSDWAGGVWLADGRPTKATSTGPGPRPRARQVNRTRGADREYGFPLSRE